MTCEANLGAQAGGKQVTRRQSRRKAFELLFELEQHPGLTCAQILERTFADPEVIELHATDEDSEGYVSGPLPPAAQLFIRELVEAVITHQASLDLELAKYPHDWSYDRIGCTERILLRLALAEMIHLGTSHKVVINEALDLSKLYAQDDARRFINGILGAVVRNFDPQQPGEQAGEPDPTAGESKE
jgi:transcription antitermination protein NusB